MNIFDLRGSDFLAVYLLIAFAVLAVAWLSRRLSERAPDDEGLCTDAYALAYLRAGAHGAVEAACAELLARGVLRREARQIERADDRALERAVGPLERAIVGDVGDGARVSRLPARSRTRAACERIRIELRRRRLLPSSAELMRRMVVFACACLVLLSIAGFKIAVALERGRHNIGFLIILAIAACCAVAWITLRRASASGIRALDHARNLLHAMRAGAGRLDPTSPNGEVALLAGAFGVAALPASIFPHRALFELPRGRPAKSIGGDNWWIGIGCSSGSSSSGSSCSSACGGGCGGGCGGCGS